MTVCDKEAIPFGSLALLENIEAVLPRLLETIIPQIGKDDIVVCGDETARRILGRKLEDRLQRVVAYEV
jgi:hypothetical protein